VIQIRIQGRGGQGTQVACQLLAAAFRRAGSWVQVSIGCNPGCGGGLVTGTVRVDTAPIGLGHEATPADHLIILDPILLPGSPLERVRDDGVIVVDAAWSPCGRMPTTSRVVAVDATAIARRAGLDPLIGAPLLGAFAAATRLVPLDDLVAAVEADSPVLPRAHAAACREGYQEARALVAALPVPARIDAARR
jgi:2-oxoacid:acceptor oxidoreductase gamma subunit (pyruvate/2-ketoisovalerate family)